MQKDWCSNMKKVQRDYTRHPESEINGDTKTIQYDLMPGHAGKQGYIYMHEEDVLYIHYWLNRLVVDITAKQFLAPELFEYGTRQRPRFSRSTYSKSVNSMLSYASGLVCNRLRNPEEDFSKNQLQYITKLFDFIHKSYDGNVFTEQDLGYNHITKEVNEKPFKIKFKLLGSTK